MGAFGQRDIQVQLQQLLASSGSLASVLQQAAEIVSHAIPASHVLSVAIHGDHSIEMAGVRSGRRIPEKDIHALLEITTLTHRSAIQDESLRRLLVSHRFMVVVPLVRQGTVIGCLLLGEKIPRRVMMGRTRRALEDMATQIAVAVYNAIIVQELSDVNAHLEQRIATATKELRTSNAALQKLDQAKDEFISMASHQLRTPLTSIKGYISMMMEGDVGPVTSEQKKILEEAFLSSERMVRLIGDFLNVSRLQTGKFLIEKHEVDLVRLVAQEINALETTAEARGLSFTYAHPKTVPAVTIDEGKFQQVVMNFLDNALFYSPAGSVIHVAVKKKADTLEFTVKDNGIGVPKDQQAGLFTKFYRATNARKHRPDGTGVGLFLTKKVLDAHDGEPIFSSIENKGSTFGFRLPLK